MSVEIKRTPIFSDPDLKAEHSALHTMACIIAQKWMLDLESNNNTNDPIRSADVWSDSSNGNTE